MATRRQFNTVDEYISAFPAEVQSMLSELRQTIKEIAPQAQEKISYQIPAFTLNGNLVHFAAYKNHIGLYGHTSSAIEPFEKELSDYKVSKGTIQFPIDKPLPLPLIRKIVELRVKENQEREKKK